MYENSILKGVLQEGRYDGVQFSKNPAAFGVDPKLLVDYLRDDIEDHSLPNRNSWGDFQVDFDDEEHFGDVLVHAEGKGSSRTHPGARGDYYQPDDPDEVTWQATLKVDFFDSESGQDIGSIEVELENY